MKKIKLALLAVAAALPLLQSCNDDYNPIYSAYVTVNTTGTADYFFTMDNGKTLYPAQKKFPFNPTDADGNSKNGKRAFIIFDYLNKSQVAGYDHSIVLYDAGDILSKNVETAESTADADERFGNKLILVKDRGLNDKWLSIIYDFPYSPNTSYHRISLVNNLQAELPTDMPQDYTYLEFRHKEESSNESKNSYMSNIVSYDLGDLHPAVTGKKGLYIAIINSEGEPTYEKIDYSAK